MRLAQLLRSDERGEFISALTELSSMPIGEAIGILDQLAQEADGTYRSRALDGLAKISPEKAESLALQFLHDAEWFVRVNAVNTLCRLDSRAAAPLIAHRLATDPDEIVRSWAAFALGYLGDASVIPVLKTAAEVDTGTNHEGLPIEETALKSIERIRSRLADKDNTATS
jgi:HEAT repeat protein